MSRPKIKMSGRTASTEIGELCIHIFVAHKSQERKSCGQNCAILR